MGLFAGRQTQRLKQRLGQLLGAVHVELVAHLGVDALQNPVQFRPQRVAKGTDAIRVHRKADALHVRQHSGQRQFHFVMERSLGLFVQLCGQQFQKALQHARVRVGLAVEFRRYIVFGGQRCHRVAAGGGVEQIRRQLAVKLHRRSHAPRLQRAAEQRLCVKGPHGGGAVQQRGKAGILHRVDLLPLHSVPAAVGSLRHAAALLQHKGQGGGLHFGQRRGGGGGGSIPQRPPLGEFVHLQPGQKVRRRGGVPLLPDIVGGLSVDGRIGADGAQHEAQFRFVAVVRQIFPLLGLDRLVVKVVIHPLQAAEFLDEGQRGLFPDARHAGDVVGGVPHQAFHINELPGLHAVFFKDGGGVHHQRFLVGGQQHGGGVAHQLQAVPVAGGQQRGAARRGVGGGQCA